MDKKMNKNSNITQFCQTPVENETMREGYHTRKQHCPIVFRKLHSSHINQDPRHSVFRYDKNELHHFVFSKLFSIFVLGI